MTPPSADRIDRLELRLCEHEREVSDAYDELRGAIGVLERNDENARREFDDLAGEVGKIRDDVHEIRGDVRVMAEKIHGSLHQLGERLTESREHVAIPVRWAWPLLAAMLGGGALSGLGADAARAMVGHVPAPAVAPVAR